MNNIFLTPVKKTIKFPSIFNTEQTQRSIFNTLLQFKQYKEFKDHAKYNPTFFYEMEASDKNCSIEQFKPQLEYAFNDFLIKEIKNIFEKNHKIKTQDINKAINFFGKDKLKFALASLYPNTGQAYKVKEILSNEFNGNYFFYNLKFYENIEYKVFIYTQDAVSLYFDYKFFDLTNNPEGSIMPSTYSNQELETIKVVFNIHLSINKDFLIGVDFYPYNSNHYKVLDFNL